MLASDRIPYIRILLISALPDPALWSGPAATQLERQIEQLLSKVH